MRSTHLLLFLLPIFTAAACAAPHSVSPSRASFGYGKLLVAHLGASGYAPEHTLAAYRLVIEQGAD